MKVEFLIWPTGLANAGIGVTRRGAPKGAYGTFCTIIWYILYHFRRYQVHSVPFLRFAPAFLKLHNYKYITFIPFI